MLEQNNYSLFKIIKPVYRAKTLLNSFHCFSKRVDGDGSSRHETSQVAQPASFLRLLYFLLQRGGSVMHDISTPLLMYVCYFNLELHYIFCQVFHATFSRVLFENQCFKYSCSLRSRLMQLPKCARIFGIDLVVPKIAPHI